MCGFRLALVGRGREVRNTFWCLGFWFFLATAGLAVLRREETPGHEVGDKTVGDSTIQSRVRCVRYDERKHEYQYREGVCEVVAV